MGSQTTGVATLDLTGGGTLTVDQPTVITARGKLTGDGIINALGGISNAGEIDLGTDSLQIAGGVLTNTGLIRGNGWIDNALNNTSDGELRVGPGHRLHLTDTGDQANAGRIDIVGNATQTAQIEFDGTLTNAVSTGNITASHAVMRFNGGLTNQGTVEISSGTSNVYGDIDNQSEATITATSNSNVTFLDDVVNNGTLQVSEGSTAVYFGSVTGNRFTGSGTTFVEGDLSPGSSPGSMSFGGDVVLGSLSTTLIELAGTANGEYDRLLVAGALDVSGALEVQLIDGFTPTGDTAFHVLDATDLSGAFSSLVLPDLLGNLSWDSLRLYSSGTLSMIPEPATLSLLTLGGLVILRRRH